MAPANRDGPRRGRGREGALRSAGRELLGLAAGLLDRLGGAGSSRILVPLAVIAVGSGVVGVVLGASAGGQSEEERLEEARVAAKSINRRPRVIGCDPGSQTVITNGPRSAKRVALTFDDGPGPDTRKVMRILLRNDTKATFFVTGDATTRDPETVAMLAAMGFELGSHSMSHEEYPAFASLWESRRLIQEASGFEPCLFRPPYGLTNALVESDAAASGMATVLWDVDTSDYAATDPKEILAQTASTQSGSILVMHDGPEERQATVEALPDLIRRLTDEGYELVTVTELLGNAFIPAPR